MRAVNLIPSDQRKSVAAGGSASGPGLGPASIVGYALVAALLVMLGGAYLLVSTSNNLSERKGEITQLNDELTAATARAEALSPYIQFAATAELREATVVSLAKSRFDWERVLRELSLVIPNDVWLTQMTATAVGESSADAAAAGSAVGPTLEIAGCAKGHIGVGEFTEALEDIDGVGKVGLTSSSVLPPVDPDSPEQVASAGQEGCSVRDFLSTFAITVEMDANPDAAGATTVPSLPEAAVPSTPDGSQTAAASDSSGVSTGMIGAISGVGR